MVEIIAGEKGTGKTKTLITKANDAALLTSGSIVFLDKNNKHMYELSNQIRMINATEFHIDSFDMFRGFLYGIVSQNWSLDAIFLDSFLTIAHVEDVSKLQDYIDFLEVISKEHNLRIIVSVSADKNQLPESIRKYISVAL